VSLVEPAAAALALQGLAEPELRLVGDVALAPRLVAAACSLSCPIALRFDARGSLTSLRVVPQPVGSGVAADGEASLRVWCVGLNFRDVLNVLGAYPGDPGAPGSDCAARVAALGAAAGAELAVGGCVLGHAVAALASLARADVRLLAARPAELSPESACTLPTVWSTVHAAFCGSRPLARHRLLVHAGAGGVGLAAVEYSHWLRLATGTTAGRPRKHRVLRALGLEGGMGSSRDGGAYASGLAALRSRRLDCVLNSLSGDFIACSVALAREGGTFAEIGKRGVWSSARAWSSAAHLRYEVLALDATMEHAPEWTQHALRQLAARARRLVLHGLPLELFDLESEAVAAFRYLQSGSNSGKVVLRVAFLEQSAHGSHIVTGGSGGLAFVTAGWLVGRGASAVVLSSRSGRVGAAQADTSAGSVASCALLAARCDASEPADVRRLVGVREWRGVWHAAGVLSDGLLRSQTAASLRRVYAPKAGGAWCLQSACAAAPLDSFVLFSSMAALFGAGQSNYSAANCCLDALSARRRGDGLAASSVQWGPWADVGMAAGGAVGGRLQATGVGLITAAQGRAALAAAAVPQAPPVLALLVVDWRTP